MYCSSEVSLSFAFIICVFSNESSLNPEATTLLHQRHTSSRRVPVQEIPHRQDVYEKHYQLRVRSHFDALLRHQPQLALHCLHHLLELIREVYHSDPFLRALQLVHLIQEQLRLAKRSPRLRSSLLIEFCACQVAQLTLPRQALHQRFHHLGREHLQVHLQEGFH